MRRHACLVVLVVVLLAAGIVPASAQLVWAGALYLENDVKMPAGRISVWFSTNKYTPPVFYYKGESHEIMADADDPAYRYCFASVELTGPYANQKVGSTWDNLGSMDSNTFFRAIGPGEQEARFFIKGKEKRYLRVAFFSIPIGSSTVTTEQSFRVLAQSAEGASDFRMQLDLAKNAWPSAGEDVWMLWARLYVYESWYKAQGMVLAGTARYPRNTTATLRDWLTMMQAQSDAKAQTESQHQADAPKPRAEDPAPKKAFDPPAVTPPVTDPAPPAPSAKITWRLVLPPGQWGINIWFGDKVLPSAGPYSGTIKFQDVSSGEVRVQLTSPQTASEWRSVTPSDQSRISWNTMQEVQ